MVRWNSSWWRTGSSAQNSRKAAPCRRSTAIGSGGPVSAAFWDGFEKALADKTAKIDGTGTIYGHRVYWVSFPGARDAVRTQFAIDRTGAVALAADAGSALPDRDVVACIVRGFADLSFPAPEGGTVTVVYPIVLVPGG